MLEIISHPDCARHDPGPDHPESAGRLHAVNDAVIMSHLDMVARFRDAPLATREQLERVHDRDYVEHIFETAPSAGRTQLDADTVMSPGTLNAALRAAGAGVLGVDLIMGGEASRVFCAVRPPGHHAGRAFAMGFCIFNNVAVAAYHALAAHGLKRIAIVDFDVHQGNGTEDIVDGDERVLMCSSFQHPFYPHGAAISDTPGIVRVPLPVGTGSVAFCDAMRDAVLPALEAFRPELIFISAGFDGHVLEQIAGFALTEADFGWLTGELVAVANAHAEGRVLSTLEGGYEHDALARSVASHLRALAG